MWALNGALVAAVEVRSGEVRWCAFDVDRDTKGLVKGYRVKLGTNDGIVDFNRRGIGKGDGLKWWRLIPEGWTPEQAAEDLMKEYSCAGLVALSDKLPNRPPTRARKAHDPRQRKLF